MNHNNAKVYVGAAIFIAATMVSCALFAHGPTIPMTRPTSRPTLAPTPTPTATPTPSSTPSPSPIVPAIETPPPLPVSTASILASPTSPSSFQASTNGQYQQKLLEQKSRCESNCSATPWSFGSTSCVSQCSADYEDLMANYQATGQERVIYYSQPTTSASSGSSGSSSSYDDGPTTFSGCRASYATGTSQYSACINRARQRQLEWLREATSR